MIITKYLISTLGLYGEGREIYADLLAHSQLLPTEFGEGAVLRMRKRLHHLFESHFFVDRVRKGKNK